MCLIKSPINSSDEVRVDNNIVDRDELWVYDLNDKGTMARNNSISEIVLDDLYFLDEELLARLDELNQSLIDTDEKVASGDLIFDGTGYYSALLYEDYSVQSAKNSFSLDISWYKLPIQINMLVRISKFRWAWRTVTIGYLPIPVLKGYNIQLEKSAATALGTITLGLKSGTATALEKDSTFTALNYIASHIDGVIGVVAKISKYDRAASMVDKIMVAMSAGNQYTQINEIHRLYPKLSYSEVETIHGFSTVAYANNAFSENLILQLLNAASNEKFGVMMGGITTIIHTVSLIKTAIIVGDVATSILSGSPVSGAATLVIKAIIAALGSYVYNAFGENMLMDGLNCSVSNSNNVISMLTNWTLQENGANKVKGSNCSGINYKINTALRVKIREYVY